MPRYRNQSAGSVARRVAVVVNTCAGKSLLSALNARPLFYPLQADWEAIKVIRAEEGAFATNSERRNNWAAKNTCATFCLIMVLFLVLASGLAVAIIFGMKMHRNGRIFNIDSPPNYCEEGGDCEKTGFGKFVWRSGAYYEGQWLHGTRHGQGKFVHPPGHEPSVIEGNFVYGKIQEGYSPTADGGFKSNDDDL